MRVDRALLGPRGDETRLPFRIVRPVLVCALAGLLVVAGCGGGDDDDTAPHQTTPTVEELAGNAFTSTSSTGYQFVPGTRLELGFPDVGTLDADAGCNSFFGDYRIEGGTLVVGELGATLIGCPPELQQQDEWLSAFLDAGPAVTLDGNTLTLTGVGTTVVLQDRAAAAPDVPLEDTRWIVDTVSTADTVEELPQDTTAYVELVDGTVRGSTGCSDFTGPATVGADTIDFGALEITERACPDQDLAGPAVEAQVLAVLSGQVAYEINGERATLTHGSGRALGLRADTG
jgi:heat shock protein HslJ